MWLFVAFIAVPIIEIALFIQVGGLIGLWPTLGIVILTAIIGTSMMRAQGRMALGNLRKSFERLDDPSEPLAHGAMILLAGALLLTPGFFTDAVGFSLLLPPVRAAVLAYAKKRVTVARFQMGPLPGAGFPGADSFGQQTQQRPSDASYEVIDGEFTELPQGKSPNHPGSGWTKH